MSFLLDGLKTEEEFAKLFNDVTHSTKEEDMHEHWDVKIHTKVDVKKMKKVRRGDAEPNEHIHWLELKNVNGDKGWVYGQADAFAFEIKDYWIYVEKSRLQDFISRKIKKERSVVPTLYKIYQRQNRKDLITLVTSYDLCSICSQMITKKNEQENTEA